MGWLKSSFHGIIHKTNINNKKFFYRFTTKQYLKQGLIVKKFL